MTRDAWFLAPHARLATLAAQRRHQHHQKRWPSSFSHYNPTLLSCSSQTQGKNRRIWYNPERSNWRKKRPRMEPTRHWLQSDDFPSTQTQDKFFLMSYNILGDNNASYHSDLYVNIPFNLLRWESRKLLICQEICRWNADIVCLQEVDRYIDILTSLKKEGYAGSFKVTRVIKFIACTCIMYLNKNLLQRRTGEAKDGCAIFWKKKRFHLLEEESIEFSVFGLGDNVAQLIVFELCEDSSRRVIVGNIHVLFNPKRGDIKLGQVRMLLSKAYALSEKWEGIPVVLAGDFNSTPMSPIYEFLSSSELNVTGCDRRDLSGQERLQSSFCVRPRLLPYCWSSEELRNATGDSKCTKLVHPLKLQSSYATVKSNAMTRGPSGEPSATSYHSKFLGTVDYLWYSAGVASTSVLDTLSVETLKNLGGLPSKQIGSDHLALVAEFAFTKSRELLERDPTNTNKTEQEEDCHSL